MGNARFEPLSAEVDRQALQRTLAAWLPLQRWFGAKTRAITSVEITDWTPFSAAIALIFAQVRYSDGEPDTYQLPLKFDFADDIHDATQDEDFRHALLQLIADEAVIDLHRGGSLRAHRSAEIAPRPSRVVSAEQSNTSIIFGDTMILKLFRRLQPGQNPDVEISRFLTEVAHFPHIPKLLGEINVQLDGQILTSIAMVQEFILSEGDGWKWTLDQLARSDGAVTSAFLEEIRLLGRRTAEMHLALAVETADEGFSSEPITSGVLADDAARIRYQISIALDALEHAMPCPSPEVSAVLSNRFKLLEQVDAISEQPASGRLIRVHGDYHLGQTLRTADDFVLLDFEGEPAASLAERRKKRCPLKDVAGMLRSFSYAAWTGLRDRPSLIPPWQNAVSEAFLSAYRQAIATHPHLLPEPPLADALLHGYLIEKACYELLYELNNRPDWIAIPIAGILDLLAYT